MYVIAAVETTSMNKSQLEDILDVHAYVSTTHEYSIIGTNEANPSILPNPICQQSIAILASFVARLSSPF